MLTLEQREKLAQPFTFREHGWLATKRDDRSQDVPYIHKSAIRRRLASVDLNYQMLPPELISADQDVVVMRGGLVVCDVKVYGIGTGKINHLDNGKEKIGLALAGEISKAYKASASDILTRAALELNCGAYLKEKPKTVTPDKFADWLKSLSISTNGSEPPAATQVEVAQRRYAHESGELSVPLHASKNDAPSHSGIITGTEAKTPQIASQTPKTGNPEILPDEQILNAVLARNRWPRQWKEVKAELMGTVYEYFWALVHGLKLYENKYEAQNSVKKMIDVSGELRPGKHTLEQALIAVYEHQAAKTPPNVTDITEHTGDTGKIPAIEKAG